jgi:hypothetical protein
MSKYNIILIVICGFSMVLYAQEIYPVYAYHTKDSTWFDNIGQDSLGLNTVHFHDLSFSQNKIL